MITNKRQLSLNCCFCNIGGEQFGGQREVLDSQLCTGQSLYCAALEPIQLNQGTKEGKWRDSYWQA